MNPSEEVENIKDITTGNVEERKEVEESNPDGSKKVS